MSTSQPAAKPAPVGHQSSDVDGDLVLLDGENERERETQIQHFIVTCRALFGADGIEALGDAEVAKWLFAKGGHRGKAMAALSESLTWRQNLRVPTLLAESFSDLDSTGKLQFWGTALDRSPVLVWTGSRHAPTRTDADMDREMRYILYTLERARHSGLLKDKVTVIVDRHGMRTDKADVRLATTLAPVLQNHYPERLSRMYIFPTNTLFWMLWKVASLSLDPATIPKIHIRESPGPLAEWVSRENLFVRYGGLGVDPFDQPERAETPASGAGPTATSPEAQDAMRASHESGGARASTDSLKRPTDSTASRADSVHRASSTAIGSAAKVAAGIGGMLSSRAATLKRAVTKSDKPLVTIENVWEAPAEFQEV